MSDEVERSRRALRAQPLGRSARAVESELGGVPRIGRWALVLAAGAAAFVLGGVVAGRLATRVRRRFLPRLISDSRREFGPAATGRIRRRARPDARRGARARPPGDRGARASRPWS